MILAFGGSNPSTPTIFLDDDMNLKNEIEQLIIDRLNKEYLGKTVKHYVKNIEFYFYEYEEFFEDGIAMVPSYRLEFTLATLKRDVERIIIKDFSI